MLNDNINNLLFNWFTPGLGFGLLLGLSTWFLTYTISQVLHFFKAITK